MGKRINGRRIFKHLPAEIIEDILVNLPVKSILRFKCVSKSWRSSITSKSFINEHLNKFNSGTDFTHHNLIFAFNRFDHPRIALDPIRVRSCSIGSLLSDNDDDDYEPINPNCLVSNVPLPSPIPALNDHDAIYILGSCNGLILIRINFKKLYLCNPSTRKAKYIQFPQEAFSLMRRGWNLSEAGYGFGYMESTDDYRVVCILPGQKLYVYSSRTDSWKKIENFKHEFIYNYSSKFVNGKVHWLRDKGSEVSGGTSRWDILSLDLVDETYQIVPSPHLESDCHDVISPVLEDLGGYLSLICYYDLLCMDIWVMKEESWSKICTFERPLRPRPLWVKKNGDILVSDKSNLVAFYNGKYKVRQSRYLDVRISSRIESMVYVESLVSPFSDDEQLQGQ